MLSHKRKYRIKDMPFADRPREKLLAKSAKTLSDAELLAVLIGTGSAKQNAVRLGELILRRFPSNKLANMTLEDLETIPGIGKSKAARIYAALELGERVYSSVSFTKTVLRSTHDVLQHLKDIVDKKQEHLVVLYMNARYELLQKEIVGIGSLNSLMITPKEIFNHSLKIPCAFIIVAHNHPSGDPQPSDDDIQFTKRIHEAGEIMSIPMIDHIIVARQGYFSFKDNKTGK